MSKKLKFIDGNMVEYELLNLVDQYDPILRKPTEEIDFEKMEGGKIAYYAISLAETLDKLAGLGLSANQVGLPYKMCAINMGEKIWIMINPVVVESSEQKSEYKEGCLSFPGLFLKVKRPQTIRVKFQALNGEVIEQQFDGLTATVIQHELDHLNGVCYTDLVSPITLDMAKRKIKANLRKMKRLTAA